MTRVPATARAATVALALALALVAMAGWEAYLRDSGEQAEIWASVPGCARRLARPASGDARRVLVMGSSRVQAGVRPETMEAGLGAGYEVRNLGVTEGSGPLALQIWKDQLPPGDVVVLEFLPHAAYQDRESDSQQQLRGLTQRAPGVNALEDAARDLLLSTLISARTSTSPSDELRRALRGAFLAETEDAAGWVIKLDGWQYRTDEDVYHADYDASLAREIADKASDRRADLWQAVLTRLKADMIELEQAGVQLYFIRPPSTGETRKAEEAHFPRAVFWDRLEQAFPGRCWHYLDEAETAGLETCDGSHLTRKAALAYSLWLGAKLRAAERSAGR